MTLEVVTRPCHRCGDRAFRVSSIAPCVELCADCSGWIGNGSLISLTAEYLNWDTRPDVTNLAAVYGTCYQRLIKGTARRPVLVPRVGVDTR